MDKNKEQFFLDVFNNILDYNNSKVIILFDIDGNIWFGFNDILKMLGYNDAKHGIDDINIDLKFKKNY
jgi:prophage antirepressor-like protein